MDNLFTLLGSETTEELLQLIVKNAPVGIYTINKKGIIDFVKPKFAEISGDSEIQLLGLNALTLPTYEHFGLLPYLIQGLKGKSFKTEIRYVSYISKKESYRNYIGIPLTTSNNEVERLLLLVEDITERKRLEIQLEETVKIKAQEMEQLNQKILDQEVKIAKLEKEVTTLRKPLGLQ